MTTILEQLRAYSATHDEDDLPWDLVALRQVEINVLRPRLTCCAAANLFTRLGADGIWYCAAGNVNFCPRCGTRLPAVRLKAVQSPTLCVVDDGGDRCRCCDRLPCWCDPPESAYEVVGPGMFYIQDARSFVGNDVSWWRPNSGGYTCQIDEAGLYDEAFCRGKRDSEVIWRWEDIQPLATRVVDVQRMAKNEPVVFDPLWANKRPDLVALWHVVETGKGSAEMPECVARHMLSYRNWHAGDHATVRHGGIITCDRPGGWSCAPEVMIDCIEKAVAE